MLERRSRQCGGWVCVSEDMGIRAPGDLGMLESGCLSTSLSNVGRCVCALKDVGIEALRDLETLESKGCRHRSSERGSGCSGTNARA